ncbi:hypothetical protein [Hoylesella nanceiensis]|uniref:hypothetical protein n=1 Tax=Hoylesella nanceiensis TaxID=425941 RepID=UPI001CB302C0|nr:hypothetical protein [Hoylesella nanceiensis]MBF1427342.1 hypothetical protein [Hoylesella nanceiensis]
MKEKQYFSRDVSENRENENFLQAKKQKKLFLQQILTIKKRKSIKSRYLCNLHTERAYLCGVCNKLKANGVFILIFFYKTLKIK